VDRCHDLRIMSPSGRIEGKEDKGLGSAKSSKVLQNPQQNSNIKMTLQRSSATEVSAVRTEMLGCRKLLRLILRTSGEKVNRTLVPR